MTHTWKNKALWLCYGLALVIFVLDQVTKTWAEQALGEGQQIVVASFFKFQLAYNLGAAFSFLNDAGGWQRWLFSGIAFAVSVLIVIWLYRIVAAGIRGRIFELLGLSLILGGALGNLYDRVVLGHVVDFIVWHYQHYYWPTFNIADAAVCSGAAALLIDMFRNRPASATAEAKDNG